MHYSNPFPPWDFRWCHGNSVGSSLKPMATHCLAHLLAKAAFLVIVRVGELWAYVIRPLHSPERQGLGIICPKFSREAVSDFHLNYIIDLPTFCHKLSMCKDETSCSQCWSSHRDGLFSASSCCPCILCWENKRSSSSCANAFQLGNLLDNVLLRLLVVTTSNVQFVLLESWMSVVFPGNVCKRDAYRTTAWLSLPSVHPNPCTRAYADFWHAVLSHLTK